MVLNKYYCLEKLFFNSCAKILNINENGIQEIVLLDLLDLLFNNEH